MVVGTSTHFLSRVESAHGTQERRSESTDTESGRTITHNTQMKKSDSGYSLPWDDALEQARAKALAPDAVQSVFSLPPCLVDIGSIL